MEYDTVEEWLAAVDKIMSDTYGIVSGDMADFCIWDCWNSGMSPEEGAIECLENDTLGQAFLEEVGYP